MKRFIFLTFGFMGWAFYEMSGGADFVPAGPQMASSETAASALIASAEAGTTSSNLVTATAANAARKAESPITPFAERAPARDVTATRVALNLTTLSDLPQANDAMVQKAVATPADRAGAKVVKAVSTSAPKVEKAAYSTTSANAPVVIQSLINATDNGTTYVSTTQADIRKVNGTRVNVRGGPGTNFGVVGKLGKGDAVEVVEDNGAGWVRFRSVDGTASGWMADFLLNNG
ncbi:SH3 domain-containing protein [uncultured Sulfitobacter sp.]|uniref:SH3 domain-containing protein n=1 Tax=uncultured Sulfitobacter sp. TaxID=191468 RepID=UPI0030D89B86